MPENVPLEPGEQELMRTLANFANRKAVNGVYLGTFYSASVGAQVLVLVALGEQAEVVQRIVMSAAVPDDEIVIAKVSGGAEFLN